jgi:flagellar basal body rod protein FlgC
MKAVSRCCRGAIGAATLKPARCLLALRRRRGACNEPDRHAADRRLTHFLDATAYRSGIIAGNIANIDTPGYHARDLDFRSQLTSLMSDDPQPGPPLRHRGLRAHRAARRQQRQHRSRGTGAGPDAVAVPDRRRADEVGDAPPQPGHSRRSPAMNLFGVMGISASGLTAERTRAEVVAGNMANAESTHTAEGGPISARRWSSRARRPPASACSWPRPAAWPRRKRAGGVAVRAIVSDPAAPVLRYEPTASGRRRRRLCRLSQHQSGAGDDRPDGGRARLSDERLGGAGRQADDPAVDRTTEIGAETS